MPQQRVFGGMHTRCSKLSTAPRKTNAVCKPPITCKRIRAYSIYCSPCGVSPRSRLSRYDRTSLVEVPVMFFGHRAAIYDKVTKGSVRKSAAWRRVVFHHRATSRRHCHVQSANLGSAVPWACLSQIQSIENLMRHASSMHPQCCQTMQCPKAQ